MFDVRKIGLTAIAFGVMTAPALAQMGNPELNRGGTQSPAAVHNDFEPYNNTNNANNFNDFDTNGDDQITQDEFSNSVDAGTSIDTFGELDVDLNGSLDQQEFSKLSQMEMNTSRTTDAR